MKEDFFKKKWSKYYLLLLILALMMSCKKSYPSKTLVKLFDQESKLEDILKTMHWMSDGKELAVSAFKLIDTVNVKKISLTIEYYSIIESDTLIWSKLTHDLYLCQAELLGKTNWIPFKSRQIGLSDNKDNYLCLEPKPSWMFIDSMHNFVIFYPIQDYLGKNCIVDKSGNIMEERSRVASIIQAQRVRLVSIENEIEIECLKGEMVLKNRTQKLCKFVYHEKGQIKESYLYEV